MTRKILRKILMGIVIAILVLGTSPLPLGALTSVMATGERCSDIQFVFARGSGETLRGTNSQAWEKAMGEMMDGSGLSYGFYELGSKSYGGASYPAVTVGVDNADGPGNLIGALVGAGEAYNFGKSVDSGIAELKSYIAEVSNSCPGTRFVIGGYSQGAMVMSKAMKSLDARKVLYVATFGDPKLYLPEGKGPLPLACQGKNLSPYRAYVPDCRVYEGILGGYNPYEVMQFANKVGAWCNKEDIMCGSSWKMSNLNILNGHITYVEGNLFKDATRKIWEKIRAAFSGSSSSKIVTGSAHDTAILIDSTGSMTDLIDNYKAEARKLAAKTIAEGGRIALVEYRDLGDPFEPVEHCGFGCTLDEFEAELAKITTDGGGDTEESALSALLTTMNILKWRLGATKSIVLLTDAGYHEVDLDGTTLGDVAKRSLEIDPVNIYPITSTSSAYQELAEKTGGKVFSSVSEMESSTEYIMKRPTAILALPSYVAEPGTEIYFSAEESSAENGIDHYEWDLDFDGSFETITTAPQIAKTYTKTGNGQMQVKVVDKAGLSSTMSAEVRIGTIETEKKAEIIDFRLEKTGANTAKASFRASDDTDKVLVALNDAIMGWTNQDFEITGIDGDLTVRLVPFSRAGSRGIAVEKTITGERREGETANIHLDIKAPDCGIVKKEALAENALLEHGRGKQSSD